MINVIKKQNKAALILLVLTIQFFSCFGQNTWYRYDWAGQMRQDNRAIYNYALNFNLTKYHNNIYIGEQHKLFAQESALSIFDNLNNGSTYTSLEGYEGYVKKVLEAVVKDTSVTNRIRIYFSRDDEFNASIDGSGFLLINVGIIESMASEAELALLLGHEVAHYLNEDAIKNYGKWLEIKYADRFSFGPFPRGTIVAGVLQAVNTYELQKSYYWFSREQEAAADEMSLTFLKESPYSLNAASQLLRKMKRIEIRTELRNGRTSKAFVSHPDPGDRLSRIKILAGEVDDKIKASFVVDSNAFIRLREICHQETVNMGLINNNLDELITNLFSRYLLEPENQQNIAFLIECLRRKLAFGRENKDHDQSFILSQYQTKAIEAGSNYQFLRESKPSVLNHLKRGFVNIWKEDFNKINASDLRDTTTTEFTTNIEAYLYFKDKAKQANNQLAEHYKYFGLGQDYGRVDQYIANNNLFASNDYLSERGVIPIQKKDIFILVPPEATNILNALGSIDLDTYVKGNNLLHQAVTGKLGNEVFLMSDFNYNEVHLLNSLMAHCSYYLKLTKDPVIKRKQTDWTEVLPELYSFFKKYHIGNIYLYRATLISSKELNADFYKMALPDAKSYTLSGQRKVTKVDGEEQMSMDFEKISNQILSFYKSCSYR